MNNEPQLLVLGIGQELRGDDAAGPAAIRHWLGDHPGRANETRLTIETSQVPGIELLHRLEGYCSAVLIDAVCSGAPPGTIHLLELDDLRSFEVENKSAHGWGVAETLLLGYKLKPDTLPKNLVFIGIEGEDFRMGIGLSTAVREAMARAVEVIERHVAGLLCIEEDHARSG